MASHRLNHIKFDPLDLEIQGYSVAGEETVIALPTLDVCFDIGKAPDQTLSVNNVLLTHGHMDHAAGIAYYCSQRNFREMTPGRIFLPEKLTRDLEDLLDCWGRIDGSRPPARIVAMNSGDEFEIRRGLFVRAFATNHGAPSLGYTIIERRKKLKPEYLQLPGPEIAKLRRAGTEITKTLEFPIVTYLGDTMGGDFEQLPCVRQSKILITECTFFEPDHHQRARAGKHYHLENLAQALTQMENELIILTHLSRRTDLEAAREKVQQVLPPAVASKVRFLMERTNRPRRKTPPNPQQN